MKMRKLVSTVLVCVMIVTIFTPAVIATPVPNVNQAGQTEEFYDDFSGDSLDTSKWLIAEKMWGGWNGGVVPENVSVSEGTLKLEGHGNLYTGDVQGCNKYLPGGIRTGAAIATRNYYASGSYEVVAKIAPELGACSAIWTFQYEEYPKGSAGYNAFPDQTGAYAVVNHEIDIELPTANADFDTPTFHAARFNTYVMENRSNSHFHTLPNALDDDQWHTFRFDWHTGDETEQARVDFYIDGELLYTSYEYIPTNASRLWIGIWFPSSIDSDNDTYGDTGWTGTADFYTTVFEIDSVRITPYCEAGDTIGNETYPKDGWAADSFPEDIEAENYEHVINGDFSAGTEGWIIDGEATVVDGRGKLNTGSATRTLSQIINVQPKMTYTLKADIVSDGTEVTLGARKTNGSANTCEVFNNSGEKYITFTTEQHCNNMVVYVQVERYQEGNPAYVDNISVISGKHGNTSTVDPVDPGTIPDPPEIPEETAEYIINGDFANAGDYWNISGGTEITTGSAKLVSGSNTDRLTQTVQLEKGKTYTLSADVESCGAELQIGVNDYNGRYTNIETSTNSHGKVQLTFTTASHIDTVEVYLQVLRYQASSAPVIIKNVSLVEGEGTEEDIVIPEPEPDPDPPEDTYENLISNGDFANGSDGWSTSGSTVINNGFATLASGNDTDRLTREITVEKGKTYTLIVNVASCGAELQFGVNDYNGRYTNIEEVVTENGQFELTFTTASHIDNIEIYLQVLRYQGNNDPVIINAVKLIPVS